MMGNYHGILRKSPTCRGCFGDHRSTRIVSKRGMLLKSPISIGLLVTSKPSTLIFRAGM